MPDAQMNASAGLFALALFGAVALAGLLWIESLLRAWRKRERQAVDSVN